LKLEGESYPFEAGARLPLTVDIESCRVIRDGS
jgi:hypothetical protein